MHIESLNEIAVIGAGDMGHGIAQTALMVGYCVNLCDISEQAVEKGKNRILDSLSKFQEKGKISADAVQDIKIRRLKTVLTIKEAVQTASFIIEVVPENEALKIETLKTIDTHAPIDAIIATNTSTMSITTFAKAIERPNKFIGMHFFNPAVLMRLVEIVQCEFTSKETVEFASAYVGKLNKKCILAKKDTPGFIANRIAAPVIVYNGLCIDVDGLDPSDIDLSMMSMNQKMGPMELADYSGIDVMNCVLDYYHKHLNREYAPSNRATKLVKNGHYGRKTGSGYYSWPKEGRPVLDKSKHTGKYDPTIPFFIQANEACKLVAQGVCSFSDCDDAMVYGYNIQGPLDFIRQFDKEKIASALTRIAEKYSKTIFLPSPLLTSGAYLNQE